MKFGKNISKSLTTLILLTLELNKPSEYTLWYKHYISQEIIGVLLNCVRWYEMSKVEGPTSKMGDEPELPRGKGRTNLKVHHSINEHSAGSQ
jgi:hypothetical protein